jgi:hypothetical protein
LQRETNDLCSHTWVCKQKLCRFFPESKLPAHGIQREFSEQHVPAFSLSKDISAMVIWIIYIIKDFLKE